MSIPCYYCDSEVEKERVDIGLEICYKCATLVQKVRENKSRLEKLHLVNDEDKQLTDIKAIAKVLDE